MRTSRTTLSTDRIILHRQQRSRTLGSGAPRLHGTLRRRGVSPMVGELGSTAKSHVEINHGLRENPDHDQMHTI